MGREIDWQHIAVQVARADGSFYLLTTPERDALEEAMRAAPAADPTMPFTDALEHGADLGAIVEGGRTLAAARASSGADHTHPFDD